jgi:hypothetical protein
MTTRRAKTVNINLRLPADLHKKLVEAGASNSPPSSLNSEILSRLYESFERPMVAALEKKVVGIEAYALARIQDVEAHALARMKEVDERADEMTQLMERRLAELEELKSRAEAKLK